VLFDISTFKVRPYTYSTHRFLRSVSFAIHPGGSAELTKLPYCCSDSQRCPTGDFLYRKQQSWLVQGHNVVPQGTDLSSMKAVVNGRNFSVRFQQGLCTDAVCLSADLSSEDELAAGKTDLSSLVSLAVSVYDDGSGGCLGTAASPLIKRGTHQLDRSL
jgi:hypothetical protein